MAAPRPKPRRPREVEADVRRALALREDVEVRDALEALAEEPAFSGLTHLWGPALYRRNRVLFRPFVLGRFTNVVHEGRRFQLVAWKGEVARALERWLAEVDQEGDVELFRRLYGWKLQAGGWQAAAKTWRRDLAKHVSEASSRHERARSLARFDGFWHSLDEETALALFEAAPTSAGAFILRHLPSDWSVFGGEKRKPWLTLRQRALARGDDDFHFALYRRQITIEEWERDTLRLCREVQDPDRLREELRRRHPQGWLKGIGRVYHSLLEARGVDVLPYVAAHLRDLWRGFFGRDGYGELAALALERGWLDFWGALIRTCGKPDELDTAVAGLVKERTLGDDAVQARLLALAGVGREWNFGPLGLAQAAPLSDHTAVALYERFPGLVRGPFKPHVGVRWGRAFPGLIAQAEAKGDGPLLDYLASRAAMLAAWPSQDKHLADAETLSVHYERLREDERTFSQRAASALGQIPAFSIPDYGRLIRTNRLARLFFERSVSAYLGQPDSLRDLLEAPEIHVQALALRALGADEEGARRLARENLDLLLPTLLRPLHRRTRHLAFAALANAATSAEAAARVLGRAREALDLPDQRYPKEALVGLMGRILHRWPELQGPTEKPVVYEHASAGVHP